MKAIVNIVALAVALRALLLHHAQPTTAKKLPLTKYVKMDFLDSH